MSRKLILASVFQRPWLIQQEYAYASVGILEKLLKGEPVSYYDDSDDEEDIPVGCFAISPKGDVLLGDSRDPFKTATPGSTAVIGITGPIMKYDNCGDPGTKTYGARLAQARRNPNITSGLLVTDSPGGTVDGTQELANAVKLFASVKPIIALVDGLMCSAAYWIGSSASEIIANNHTDTIGSIGTMLSFADVYKYWEKKGVEFHWVYADASKDKNKNFHDLMAGNYDLVKAELNKINDMFLGAVKSNRPGVKDTALTGKTFLAQEAISQGLIDRIGSFDIAVERAQELAGITKPVIKSQPMKKITLLAAQAALLALCGATLKTGDVSVDIELTDELVEKLNSTLTGLAQKLHEAKEKITKLEGDLATATKKATDVAAEFEAFKTSSAGASSTSTEKDGDKIDGQPGASDYTTDLDQEVAARRKALYGEKKAA